METLRAADQIDEDYLRQIEDRTRGQLIRGVMILVAMVMPVFVLYALSNPQLRHMAASWAVTGVIAVACMFAALKLKVYYAVGILLLALCVFTPIPNAMKAAGFKTLLLAELPMMPTLIALLCGSSAAVLSMILVIVQYAVVWVLHHLNYPFPLTYDPVAYRWLHVSSWLSAMIIYGLSVPFFEWQRNQPLRALQRSQDSHVQAVVELATETRKLKNAVAAYSHEIRTPLNVIAAMADSTSELQTDTELTREISLLQAASKSLLALTNNVLDVSAIEAGALRVESDDFQLSALLTRVAGPSQVAAMQKKLRFSMLIGESVPRLVNGDGLRVQQVLYNLLSNAIKFTVTGEVKLRVHRVEMPPGLNRKNQTDSQIWIQFTVTDSGPGIPPTADPPLFAKVRQSEHMPPQTALGLYICRKLVRRMHGTIALASRIHRKGTVARVTIPFNQPLMLPVPVTAVTPARELKILYADDEPANHFVLQTILHDCLHKIDTVANGVEALQAVKREHYDLVLLDVEMPLMDGVQCMHEIRAHEKANELPRVPIAFVTAHASPEFATLDIDNVIQKPVSRSWLMETITAVAMAQPADLASKKQPVRSQPNPVSKSDAGHAATEPWALLRSIFTPKNMDNVQRWKYRVALSFIAFLSVAFLIFVLYSGELPVRTQRTNAALIALHAVYPLLMRMQKQTLLVLYLPLQQMIVLFLSVTMEEFGFEGLQIGYVFTPLIFLVVGGTMKQSLLSTLLVGAEALVLAYILPYSESELKQTVNEQFMLLTMGFHVLLTVMLTLYLAFSDYSRHAAFTQLTGMLEQVQQTQRKTLRKKQITQQFVASVANDFKTPLSIVQGMAEVLAEDPALPQRLVRHMTVLYCGCQLLMNMMQNILDMQTMEQHRALLRLPSVFRLRDVVLHTANMLSFHARAKGVLLRVRVAHHVPEYISDDPARLQQVLVNLLANAIKFTRTGSVVMMVDTLRVDGEKDYDRFVFGSEPDLVPIDLSDPVTPRTAAAASAGAEPQVPFGTVSTFRFSFLEHDAEGIIADFVSDEEEDEELRRSLENSESLSSIGLRVGKALVEQIGGALTIRSSKQNGARFSCNIPLKIESGANFMDQVAPKEWCRALHVLIIDDTPELQYVFQLFLKDTPHTITAAFTGTRGMELFYEMKFDVVIVSMQLPDFNGTELLTRIRQQSTEPPFSIMLAAVITPEFRQAAVSAGADMFETKPIPRAKLIQALHGVAQRLGPKLQLLQSGQPQQFLLQRGNVNDVTEAVNRQVPLQLALNMLETRVYNMTDVNSSREMHLLSTANGLTTQSSSDGESPGSVTPVNTLADVLPKIFAQDKQAAISTEEAARMRQSVSLVAEERSPKVMRGVTQVRTLLSKAMCTPRQSPRVTPGASVAGGLDDSTASTPKRELNRSQGSAAARSRRRSFSSNNLFHPLRLDGNAASPQSVSTPQHLPYPQPQRGSSHVFSPLTTATGATLGASRGSAPSSNESTRSGTRVTSPAPGHADTPVIFTRNRAQSVGARALRSPLPLQPIGLPLQQKPPLSSPPHPALRVSAEVSPIAVPKVIRAIESPQLVPPVMAVAESIPPATSVASSGQLPAAPSAPESDQTLRPAVVVPAAEDIVGDVPPEMFDYVQNTFMPVLIGYAKSMKDAVDKGDIQHVRGTAHKIKGCAGAFGLGPVDDVARQLQALCDEPSRNVSAITELVDRMTFVADHIRLEKSE
eukprot:TRINITY_DN372_c0_g1_i3.p1 TRINITY_DN372_c0_g1~~TRINITY_DN372_c0_g1_i3.p1  ORF type:complete len:1747 (+),score=397.00 TRINITY_DN372_c0_g1_i3:95-5242(+)